MNRRSFLTRLALAAGAVALAPLACGRSNPESGNGAGQLGHDPGYWRDILPEKRFRILFQDGTEPAFSSPLDSEWREGTYVCAACYLPLFSSLDKFDSGTGWPSFTRPVPNSMGTRRDYKLILPRTEYHCIRCGGHQGHVFDDGPPPTGQRWCNNGLALEFVALGDSLPELRG